MIRIFDIRSVYVMHLLFSFYAKPGISRDADRRRQRIDGDVPGRVIKVIALPFIFASFWEGLALWITSPFTSTPRAAGPDAGRREWRWFPGMTAFLVCLVCAMWCFQVWALVYAVSWAIGYPVDIRIFVSNIFAQFAEN